MANTEPNIIRDLGTRKSIIQGGYTQMIALPRQWLEQHNIEPKKTEFRFLVNPSGNLEVVPYIISEPVDNITSLIKENQEGGTL